MLVLVSVSAGVCYCWCVLVLVVFHKPYSDDPPAKHKFHIFYNDGFLGAYGSHKNYTISLFCLVKRGHNGGQFPALLEKRW